jgi:hypothetical protein
MASLKEETAMATLREDVIQTIQSAAKLLTGHKRRRFQAETAIQYCNGSARQAEKVFGWGRAAVDTGLHELQTGIRCLDAYDWRGRKKSEELCPELIDHIHRLVEPQAQADPKFQTPFAFTRITAKAVRDALQAVPELQDCVPCRQTVGELLNRLGYRLRRVLKARPEKKFPKPTPSFTTSTPPVPRRRPTRTR